MNSFVQSHNIYILVLQHNLFISFMLWVCHMDFKEVLACCNCCFLTSSVISIMILSSRCFFTRSTLICYTNLFIVVGKCPLVHVCRCWPKYHCNKFSYHAPLTVVSPCRWNHLVQSCIASEHIAYIFFIIIFRVDHFLKLKREMMELFSFTMNLIDHNILWPYMSMIWNIDFSHRLFWHWFLYWHYGKVFTDFSFPTFNLSRLWTRKEKEIAIVTHSGFLYHTLSAFGNDCHPSIKSEICTQ